LVARGFLAEAGPTPRESGYHERVSSPITLGVVPSFSPDKARDALDDLTEHLTEALGAPVTGLQADSYGALVSELERDRVQFAWMPPALLVLAEERLELRPLVSAVRGDRIAYRSILFVDENAPYQSVEELRGATVAWVDRTSAAGYLYPRLHLLSRGLDPSTHFGKELFARSHHDVVRAVLNGRAQVGATFAERPPFGAPIRRAGFLEVDATRSVRVLEWTGLIPNDLIVAHGLLPVRQQQSFAQAILQVGATPRGRQLLGAVFQADRFMLASSKNLRPLRQLVAVAREHGLLSQL
jgi:phosphonate transport system substrate-binding protein